MFEGSLPVILIVIDSNEKRIIVKAAFELQSFGVIEKRSKIEKGK